MHLNVKGMKKLSGSFNRFWMEKTQIHDIIICRLFETFASNLICVDLCFDIVVVSSIVLLVQSKKSVNSPRK